VLSLTSAKDKIAGEIQASQVTRRHYLVFQFVVYNSRKRNLAILFLTPRILGLKRANEWVNQGHHKAAKRCVRILLPDLLKIKSLVSGSLVLACVKLSSARVWNTSARLA